MPFDPHSLQVEGDSGSIIDPRDIFAALPAKNPKFSYLRDVQAQVLAAWLARRNERDLIVKLNTGSGKTLVALLMLQSSLNEGMGPAVYLAPDHYLCNQARAEADQLGIAHCSEPTDLDFLQGRSILIDTFASLFNGKSVFGVKSAGIRIRINTLVVDDAHACLEKLEDQFTLRIDSFEQKAVYDGLLKLFERDLKDQSTPRLTEILAGDARAFLALPWWAWQDKQSEVAKLFTEHSTKFPFAWPLLRDDLKLCNVVFSGGACEIAPFCIPIHHIRSYAAAKRRIFLSATLARDGILVTHFEVEGKATEAPISPERVDDIGDRMILVPQQLNPKLTDGELVNFVASFAEKINVVVIVPSEAAAAKWKAVAKEILKADTIYSGVEKLRRSHVGLVVFINKYDGVDLPGKACELLVIDDIPAARRLVDIYADSLVEVSDDMVGRRIQRIEQGMGRGIRSNADYCAVLLVGRRLVYDVSTPTGLNKFSPATRAQMQLAMQVARQLKDASLADVRSAIEMFLRRERGWVEKSRAAVVRSGRFHAAPSDEIAVARREAYRNGSMDIVPAAEQALGKVANSGDRLTKGILLQELAAYVNLVDGVRAQEIQRAAIQANQYVLRPRQGFEHAKMAPNTKAQGDSALLHWKGFPSTNDALIAFYAILDQLIFHPDSADEFEEALKQLGPFLGFLSKRPEKETGTGPDDMWALPGGKFIFFEAKNGAITRFVSKSDCDQTGGHFEWFTKRYGETTSFDCILVHPSRYFHSLASPRNEIRVMDTESLEAFVAALKNLAIAIGALREPLTAEWLSKAFSSRGLAPNDLFQRFTKAFKTEASAPK